jgi:hypothetical protein
LAAGTFAKKCDQNAASEPLRSNRSFVIG